jgi:hypothetical protein
VWAFPDEDGELMLCVDYTEVNKSLVEPESPFPCLAKIRDATANAKWFTVNCFKNAPHQISLGESSKGMAISKILIISSSYCLVSQIEITAFEWANRQWCFNRMDPGLICTAPAIQKNLENSFQATLWKSVIVLLDVIIVYSNDFGTHLADLNNCLRVCAAQNLTLDTEKCL